MFCFILFLRLYNYYKVTLKTRTSLLTSAGRPSWHRAPLRTTRPPPPFLPRARARPSGLRRPRGRLRPRPGQLQPSLPGLQPLRSLSVELPTREASRTSQLLILR